MIYFRLIRRYFICIVPILSISVLSSFTHKESSIGGVQKPVKEYDWRVVRIFPHDSTAFTQGLIFRDGYLYESTGRKGQSEIRKIDLETGEILQRKPLEDDYFGEGLTAWNDKLIQLTLSSGIGFIYDIHTFEREQTFKIVGDAWGLTSNGEELIMSDGSSTLWFLNPVTFRVVRQVTVQQNGKPVSKLNELEMIDGKIFANRLFSDEILIINAVDGEVTGRIDLERLVTSVESNHSVSVLNGIAYDSPNKRIFITGKLWPNMFEIKFWPKNQR